MTLGGCRHHQPFPNRIQILSLPCAKSNKDVNLLDWHHQCIEQNNLMGSQPTIDTGLDMTEPSQINQCPKYLTDKTPELSNKKPTVLLYCRSMYFTSDSPWSPWMDSSPQWLASSHRLLQATAALVDFPGRWKSSILSMFYRLMNWL